MQQPSSLSPQLAKRVLVHLKVAAASPDLALLDRLVGAYIREEATIRQALAATGH